MLTGKNITKNLQKHSNFNKLKTFLQKRPTLLQT